jgi:hypothetical protein
VLLDGVALGTFSTSTTGGWQTWVDLTISGVNITAGNNRILRVEVLNGNDCNLNFLRFSSTATPTPTARPTATVRPTATARATATPTATVRATARPTPTSGTATLLSQGRPVVASSVETTAFPATLAVDGNTGTRWSSVFSDPQWIYVDLGSARNVTRVVLNWEAAYGSAYQLQSSNDAVNWSTFFTTTTGNGAVDDLAVSASGRYIRMNGTTRATAWGYSLWEFQVYGN